jgi:hypothetical protein
MKAEGGLEDDTDNCGAGAAAAASNDEDVVTIADNVAEEECGERVGEWTADESNEGEGERCRDGKLHGEGTAGSVWELRDAAWRE